MRGIPLFGTLLGLERDGELVVGVMSAPALGSRWYASRGGGAWAVDALGPAAGAPRRIGVSGVASLDDAQILHASAEELEPAGWRPGSRGSSARHGATAASATSGATPWWPRAPPRR